MRYPPLVLPNDQLIEAIRRDATSDMRLALANGASLEARSKDNLCLLELCQKVGAVDAARYLLERGVSPHVETSTRDTLLHRAARQGDYGFVVLLLEHGADPESIDGKRRRPVDVVRPKGGYVEDLLRSKSRTIQPTLF